MYSELFDLCKDTYYNHQYVYMCVLNECLQEYNVFKDLQSHHYYSKEELMEKISKYNSYEEPSLVITDELVKFMYDVNQVVFSNNMDDNQINLENRIPYYKMYPEELFKYLNDNDNYDYYPFCHPILFVDDNRKFIRKLVNHLPEFISSNITYSEFKDEYIRELGMERFKYVFKKAYEEYIYYMNTIPYVIPLLLRLYNDMFNITSYRTIQHEEVLVKMYSKKFDISNLKIPHIENDLRENIIGKTRLLYQEFSQDNALTDKLNKELSTRNREMSDMNLVFNYYVINNALDEFMERYSWNAFDKIQDDHLLVTYEVYNYSEFNRYDLKRILSASYNDRFIDYYNRDFPEDAIVKCNESKDNTSWKRFNIRNESILFKEFIYDDIANNNFNDRTIQILYSLIGYDKMPKVVNNLSHTYDGFKNSAFIINMINEPHLHKYIREIINFNVFNGNTITNVLRFSTTRAKNGIIKIPALYKALEYINSLINDYGLVIDSLDELVKYYIRVRGVYIQNVASAIMDMVSSGHVFDGGLVSSAREHV